MADRGGPPSLLRVVPATADALLPALAAALDGRGPAVLPEPVVPERVLAALRPEVPLEHDDVALVVPTSGSTGEPKGVLLTAQNLRASAAATAVALGGDAQWLLAIPATHVGGVQVLVRSLLAGTAPVVLPPGPFTAPAFAEATARLDGARRCVSLVPTQLRRLLDEQGLDALRAYDAVLLGGAAAPPAVLAAVREAGVRVVTTYGMSETSGGCVYDGRPLDGVRVEVTDGRVVLSGPVVGRGYRLRPDLTAEAFDGDAFRTSDLGRLDGGVLHVLGRLDDVIVSGGEKVPPQAVEAALASHPAVQEAAVLGLPDDVWGSRVVALVVLRAPLELTDAREHVARVLPRAWAPHALQEVPSLPVLPSGKIDRARLRWRAT